MQTGTLPTSVDVTLYRYNHIDNRLWVRIKNELDYILVDENSIIISQEQMVSLLETYYMPEISRIKSVGSEALHKKVTSPYFIYMMLKDLENLQFIKFTKSYDKEYTRLIELDGDKMLKFEFKILSMTFCLYDFYSDEELHVLNPILEKLKILEEDVPYARLKIIDLLDVLDEWVNDSISDENFDDSQEDPLPLVTELMDMIDAKTERDNPLVLLITDY